MAMRRGIRFVPYVPLLEEAPPTDIVRVEGYPVYFDDELDKPAQARGCWPFRKYIAVGSRWFMFDHRSRMAVVLHEAYHCKAWHKEIRYAVALIGLFAPKFCRALAYRQELAADQFAKAQGYGLDLARFLRRHRNVDETFHPPVEERCRLLESP